MKGYDADIQMRSTSLAVSEHLAYDSGDYQEVLTNRQSQARARIHDCYLMVLRQTAGGKWQIIQHMWTNTPAS